MRTKIKDAQQHCPECDTGVLYTHIASLSPPLEYRVSCTDCDYERA